MDGWRQTDRWMDFTNYTPSLVYFPFSYSGNKPRESWIHQNLPWSPIFFSCPRGQSSKASKFCSLIHAAHSTLCLGVKAKWGLSWPSRLKLQPILSSFLETLGLLTHLYLSASSLLHLPARNTLHNLVLRCVCLDKAGIFIYMIVS